MACSTNFSSHSLFGPKMTFILFYIPGPERLVPSYKFDWLVPAKKTNERTNEEENLYQMPLILLAMKIYLLFWANKQESQKARIEEYFEKERCWSKRKVGGGKIHNKPFKMQFIYLVYYGQGRRYRTPIRCTSFIYYPIAHCARVFIFFLSIGSILVQP